MDQEASPFCHSSFIIRAKWLTVARLLQKAEPGRPQVVVLEWEEAEAHPLTDLSSATKIDERGCLEAAQAVEQTIGAAGLVRSCSLRICSSIWTHEPVPAKGAIPQSSKANLPPLLFSQGQRLGDWRLCSWRLQKKTTRSKQCPTSEPCCPRLEAAQSRRSFP